MHIYVYMHTCATHVTDFLYFFLYRLDITLAVFWKMRPLQLALQPLYQMNQQDIWFIKCLSRWNNSNFMTNLQHIRFLLRGWIQYNIYVNEIEMRLIDEMKKKTQNIFNWSKWSDCRLTVSVLLTVVRCWIKRLLHQIHLYKKKMPDYLSHISNVCHLNQMAIFHFTFNN